MCPGLSFSFFLGDRLYSFVSRWSYFGCWSRRFDCNTASLCWAMRSIVYVSLFEARWRVAIGAFRPHFYSGRQMVFPLRFALIGCCVVWSWISTSKVTPSWDKRIKSISFLTPRWTITTKIFLHRVHDALITPIKFFCKEKVHFSSCIG